MRLHKWFNLKVVKTRSLRISLLLAIAAGSSHCQAEQSEPIGILTALDIELDLLIEKAETTQTFTIGGVDYHRARLNSLDVVLVRAGAYGMLPSATTSILIHEFGVPVIAIRTPSDKADGRAHESYANFAQDAADNSARVVLTMLKDMAEDDRRAR